MELERIVESEINQKEKYQIISLRWDLRKCGLLFEDLETRHCPRAEEEGEVYCL